MKLRLRFKGVTLEDINRGVKTLTDRGDLVDGLVIIPEGIHGNDYVVFLDEIAHAFAGRLGLMSWLEEDGCTPSDYDNDIAITEIIARPFPS